MIDERKLIEEIEMQISEIENDGSNAYYATLRVAEHLKRLINRQPKVTAWNPCSERLPQRQDSRNTFLQMYLVCSKRGVVHMGFMDEDGIWRTIHGNRIYNEVAWQPLPEPYKEGLN